MVLNNSQYDEIMRAYSARQFAARNELDRRTAEVLLAIPEYKKLLDQISTLSVNAAKSSLKGDASASQTLKEDISAIQTQLSELLVKSGFPVDYLTTQYQCSICHDTGYIGNVKCSCFKQAEIDMLYNQSNLKDKVKTENFNTFSLQYYSTQTTDSATGLTPQDNARKVLSICKDFATTFPSNRNLLFYGDTGVGKSFLSNCIAKELLDNSYSVLYMTAIELFDYFSKHNYTDNSGAYGSGNEMNIISCDLLIIDDLGTELSNSFTNSKLFYCINSRLSANKSTIISTNYSLQGLMDSYSERIFSRISSSYELLKLFGDDIRLIKK